MKSLRSTPVKTRLIRPVNALITINSEPFCVLFTRLCRHFINYSNDVEFSARRHVNEAKHLIEDVDVCRFSEYKNIEAG